MLSLSFPFMNQTTAHTDKPLFIQAIKEGLPSLSLILEDTKMNRAVSGSGWARTNPQTIPKQGRDISVPLESDRQEGTVVQGRATRSGAHKALSTEPGRDVFHKGQLVLWLLLVLTAFPVALTWLNSLWDVTGDAQTF